MSQQLFAKLCQLQKSIDSIVIGHAAASAVSISGSRSTVTGAGSTATGLQSVTFVNVGGVAVTVDGEPLLPSEDATFTGYFDNAANEYNRLLPISYDASGGSLRINQLV